MLRVVASPRTSALTFQEPMLMRSDLQGTYLKGDVTPLTALGTSVTSATTWTAINAADTASTASMSILGYNCGCSTGAPVAPGQFRLRIENTVGLDRLKVESSGNSISVVSGGGDSSNWRFYDAPPYPP